MHYQSHKPAPSHGDVHFLINHKQKPPKYNFISLNENKVLTDRFCTHKYPTNYIDCVDIQFIMSTPLRGVDILFNCG